MIFTILRQLQNDGCPAEKLDIDPVMVYHVLQVGAFGIMAMIIMRLKLFFTPQLCILSALLLHKKVKYYIGFVTNAGDSITLSYNFGLHILLIFLLSTLIIQYIPFVRSRALHLSLIGLLVAGMSIEGYSNIKKQHNTIGK